MVMATVGAVVSPVVGDGDDGRRCCGVAGGVAGDGGQGVGAVGDSCGVEGDAVGTVVSSAAIGLLSS